MSAIRIELTGHGRGKVYVDDRELPHVSAILFEAAAEDANRAVITLLADRVDITAPADVRFQRAVPTYFEYYAQRARRPRTAA